MSINTNEICNVSKYCGGCQLQGISYEKQLIRKQNYVEKLLHKYCKVNRIIGSKKYDYYRNKVQVTLGYDDNDNVIYGNYVPSTHNIVQINDCMICDKKINEIIDSLVKLIVLYKISIFDENSMRGCIRHILVKSTSLDEYMVVLVTGSKNILNIDRLIKDIIKQYPNIKTIVQSINSKHTSMILGDRYSILYGNGYITDSLCGLKFRISPSSFYQINKYQIETLYKQVIKAADIKRDDIIIDAYCGTGTIGMVASKYCDQVLGIELNSDAIKDANYNRKINKINNIKFINEDAGKFMNYLSKQEIDIDTVIMDPPRTGSDTKFINSLLRLKPRRIVYVSCNPETLKDNLKQLNKLYKVNNIQPIDMFPYTNHIECVSTLDIKNS